MEVEKRENDKKGQKFLIFSVFFLTKPKKALLLKLLEEMWEWGRILFICVGDLKELYLTTDIVCSKK